jgi:hypothetical protein
MAELAVITPSYSPDFELCRDLNESVLEYTPQSVMHYIFVPRRDLKLFSRLQGARTEVLSVDELLPRHMVAVPRANIWLNLHHPVPPVRGWVMQQLVKLLATALIDAETLLLVDSDVLLVRPVTVETFRRDGLLRFYRKDAAVDEHLPRHLIWHDAARSLLGISARARPPLPDYVSPFTPWDRRTILALQDRIQRTASRHWLDAVAGELHVSEFILYGVFVDQVLSEHANVAATESTLCHSYWHTSPLDLKAAEQFVQALPAEDVAVMISAKSHTPLAVRRTALHSLTSTG